VLLEAISSHFGISLQALAAKTRARPIAEARHAAMYLLRNDAQLTLKEIGFLLGHRDHATVIHGVKKVSRLAATDPSMAAQLSVIRNSSNLR
jgi:chromosomal replication initiator protein